MITIPAPCVQARCAPKLSTISIYHLERAIVEFLDTRVDLGSVVFPTLKYLTVIAPREKKQASALGDCSAFDVALIRYIDSRHKQHLPPLSALTISRACAPCRNTLMELERTTPYAPQYIKRLKVMGRMHRTASSTDINCFIIRSSSCGMGPWIAFHQLTSMNSLPSDLLEC